MKKRSKDEIQVLEGLRGVRERPTMYIGSCGLDGLHHCLLEIVHNSIDEHAAGYCDKINVILHTDGSVSVEDNGRGIPVELHSTAKISQLELALTRIHAGSKFFQHSSSYFSSGLNGVGASCVNALSSWMEAIVRRNGKSYFQRYEEGVPCKPVRKIKRAYPFRSGTRIQFMPDASIFETTKFDIARVAEMLDDLAYLNPKLKINIKVEESDEYEETSETYYHKKGLLDFIRWISEGRDLTQDRPLVFSEHGKTKDSHGRDFHYRMEAVLNFCKGDSDFRSFVNNVRTSDGGTHEDGFRSGLSKAIVKYARERTKGKGQTDIVPSDVFASGVVGIFAFYMHEPRFASQTKKKLTNEEVVKIVEALSYQSTRTMLLANTLLAKRLISHVSDFANLRKRLEDVKNATKKKRDISVLTGKLSDCISKKFEDRELWLVEGDSAGGSAKMGRNAYTQAILPLRGKILNVEKASLKSISSNEEISRVIQAIGTGIGIDEDYSSFNIDRLRYSKIVIATDADVDGGHIRVLLLTFFFRFMRPLVENGNIFLASPPLYGVFRRNSCVRFLRSTKGLERFMKKMKRKKKDLKQYHVQRYKGLGEMNAEQLWTTTMDPETRRLKRICIRDVKEASALIEVLMGKDSDARKDFIVDNAEYAKIDV